MGDIMYRYMNKMFHKRDWATETELKYDPEEDTFKVYDAEGKFVDGFFVPAIIGLTFHDPYTKHEIEGTDIVIYDGDEEIGRIDADAFITRYLYDNTFEVR